MITLLHRLIENVKQFGIERVFHRYYSLYRAEVVRNNDPEKRGRIMVKVPALFSDLELSAWAEPRDFRARGNGYGEFMPPNIGDFVFVEFESGDTRFPVYSGGWMAEFELGDDFKYDPDAGEDDEGPTVRGYSTPWGHKILFDETEDKQQLRIILSTSSEKKHELNFDVSKDAEKIALTTAGGHFLVLDDTVDAEGIYLIHKKGSQLQIDKEGSAKLFTSKGNFLNMSAEDGVVTAASSKGAVLTMDEHVVASDSSGKSVVTISADGVTVTTAKDLVAQCNTLTATAGAITLDGGKAKMTLGSGKVAIGNATCELVDSLIQIIGALLDDPALVMTGVGPSSGLLGTAKIQLTLIKVKLTLLKGSL